jgi:hypothetical protein
MIAQLAFCIMAGTTFHAPDNIWTTGSLLATANVSNWMSAANQNFYVSNVGLYLDPNNTGQAPEWTMPDFTSELAVCQRYWQKSEHSQTAFSTTAGTLYSYTAPLPVAMRTVPAFANIVAGTAAGGANASSSGATATAVHNTLTTSSAGVTFSVNGRVNALNARM